MRSYPADSPHAAARIVALVVVSDGHCSRSELMSLERIGAHDRLGLSREQLQEVILHLSEDLMATAYAHWGTACQIDPGVLGSLLQEVNDPDLRLSTLQLCAQVAHADFHLADAEESLIATTARRWMLEVPACPTLTHPV